MIFPIVQPVIYRGTVSDLRVSAVDDAAFVDNLDITLGNHISSSWESLASGSVTQANSRISAVDGTAFYDFGSGTNLTDNLGKYLIVKDSTGKAIKGWIKAAGTGETYSAEKITNGDMELDSNWAGSGATVNERSTEQVNAGTYSRKVTTPNATSYVESDAVTVVAGQLCRLVGNHYSTSGGFVLVRSLSSVTSGLLVTAESASAWATVSVYGTILLNSSNLKFRCSHLSSSERTFYVDDVSLKQVLTPSSTGVTIVSAKNGTTYNWESKETGFNYNDASGYTYEVFDRDFTALVGGTHLVEIYDSTGKAIAGVLGAQGSGETLGSELFPALDNPANFTNVDASWTIGEGNAVSNGNGDFHKASIVQLNALIYSSTNIVSHPSGTIYYPYSGQGSEQVMMFGTGVKTRYRTWIGVNVYLLGRSTFVGTLTDISMKQVLTPSTSGCTIVSAKGGATERFKRIDTGFAFNSSSYMVIIKKLRG